MLPIVPGTVPMPPATAEPGMMSGMQQPWAEVRGAI